MTENDKSKLDEEYRQAIDTGAVLVGGQPKRYRCSRGHDVESGIPPTLTLTFPQLGIDGEVYCVLCLRDWLREYVGRVREIA